MSFSPARKFNCAITHKEVQDAIFKGKNNKAPVLDSITYEVLKNEASVNLPHCSTSALMVVLSQKYRVEPSSTWFQNPRVPLNYRGISLLPVVSKIFTGLMASRVGGFLEGHNLLANEQKGLRSDRSGVDHIYTLNDLLRTRKSQGLEKFCSFGDFQKAFDYVDHNYVPHKLPQKG